MSQSPTIVLSLNHSWGCCLHSRALHLGPQAPPLGHNHSPGCCLHSGALHLGPHAPPLGHRQCLIFWRKIVRVLLKKNLGYNYKGKKGGFQFKSPKSVKWWLGTARFQWIVNLDLPPKALDPFRVSSNYKKGGH